MNKLLTISSVIFMIAFSTSCAKYYVAEISSPNVPVKDKTFVYENDSIKVTYHFWDEGGVMSFDIFNKTSLPIYFDWKKSAYIPNDRMLSYWQDEVNTEGVTSSSSLYYRYGASTSSKIKTKAIRQERYGVVPPKAKITSEKYALYPLDKFELNKTFTEDNSPLRFRNYLAVSGTEDFSKGNFFVDNSFYISRTFTIKKNKSESAVSNTNFFLSSKTDY